MIIVVIIVQVKCHCTLWCSVGHSFTTFRAAHELLVASVCDLSVESVGGVVTGGGQWAVDLFHCLIMKYPTPLLPVLCGSIIFTFCSNFLQIF